MHCIPVNDQHVTLCVITIYPPYAFEYKLHLQSHLGTCRWVMYNQHQAALLELQQKNMHKQIDLKALSEPTDKVATRNAVQLAVLTCMVLAWPPVSVCFG